MRALRGRPVLRSLPVAWALLSWACSGGPPERVAPERALGGGQADGTQVVVEVGQQVVTRGDVEALRAETGVSAREAVDKLVTERLLAAAAHEAGYGLREAVERAQRRAAVHALLAAEVEQPESAQDVPAERVEERLDEAVVAQTVPERRRADHILFRTGKKTSEDRRAQAQQAAQRALAELAGGDVDAVLQRYAALGETEGGVTVRVENLPPVDAKAPFEKPFLRALFAVEGTGPLGEVVETRYGYHVIVLREILPEEVPARADLEAEVRRQLLVERRGERLSALLERLRETVDVQYMRETMLSAFADRQAAP